MWEGNEQTAFEERNNNVARSLRKYEILRDEAAGENSVSVPGMEFWLEMFLHGTLNWGREDERYLLRCLAEDTVIQMYGRM